jgi:hypothetical protein
MPLIDNDQADINSIPFLEQADDPATPESGKWRVFLKAGGLYIMDDAGVVTGPLISADDVPDPDVAALYAQNEYVNNISLNNVNGELVRTTISNAKAGIYFIHGYFHIFQLQSGSVYAQISTDNSTWYNIQGEVGTHNIGQGSYRQVSGFYDLAADATTLYIRLWYTTENQGTVIFGAYNDARWGSRIRACRIGA